MHLDKTFSISTLHTGRDVSTSLTCTWESVVCEARHSHMPHKYICLHMRPPCCPNSDGVDCMCCSKSVLLMLCSSILRLRLVENKTLIKYVADHPYCVLSVM